MLQKTNHVHHRGGDYVGGLRVCKRDEDGRADAEAGRDALSLVWTGFVAGLSLSTFNLSTWLPLPSNILALCTARRKSTISPTMLYASCVRRESGRSVIGCVGEPNPRFGHQSCRPSTSKGIADLVDVLIRQVSQDVDRGDLKRVTAASVPARFHWLALGSYPCNSSRHSPSTQAHGDAVSAPSLGPDYGFRRGAAKRAQRWKGRLTRFRAHAGRRCRRCIESRNSPTSSLAAGMFRTVPRKVHFQRPRPHLVLYSSNCKGGVTSLYLKGRNLTPMRTCRYEHGTYRLG